MARPAGFSDSEDSDFDDFLHANEEDRCSPGPPDATEDLERVFDNIQVPSFKGLHPDVEGFKEALREGNLVGVKEYVDALRPQIRAPLISSSAGWSDLSPLEIAASSGQESVLAYLLEVSKNESPGDGPCPLLAIASSSSQGNKKAILSCANLLLNTEDVNRMEASSGLTPLMLASKFGFVELVQLLAEGGADVNLQDYNKWTALCHASNAGHGDVLRYLLLKAHASPNVLTSEGFEPSDLAERKGHRHILEILDAFSEVRSVFRGILRSSDPAADDIAMILRGFGLNAEEIEAFHREGISNLATLITLTEKDLQERIGLSRIGIVKSLSEFIKDMHRKEWRRSCLPKVQLYDPNQGLKFSCPECISVIGNVRKQLLYLRSTVVYLQRGISENPEVLQIGKDVGDVRELHKYSGASIYDAEGLLSDLTTLRRVLYPFLTDSYMPVDEMKSLSGSSRRRRVLLCTGSLLLSVPLAICIWKNLSNRL